MWEHGDMKKERRFWDGKMRRENKERARKEGSVRQEIFFEMNTP